MRENRRFHEIFSGRERNSLPVGKNYVKLAIIKVMRIVLSPNQAGDNRILTLQEVKFFPPCGFAARDRIIFLWGENLLSPFRLGENTTFLPG